jgi:2-keto-4-pentenoate hydratase/2-oxohepta-3-ene-1,7-dioic acid hydratase in catechol pathway
LKIVHFYTSDGLRFGVKIEAGIVDVPALFATQSAVGVNTEGIPTSLDALFSGSEAAQAALQMFIDHYTQETAGEPWLLAEEALTFAPCVPAPEKIICIGLNYRRHAAESGLPTPTTPILFSKYANALAAHGQDVPLNPNAGQNDYESELVVVIGKRARFVEESEALEYVFGYCNGNDLSARDLQMRTSQWMLGKTLDKFMPIGPYLVTADEAGDADALRIRGWLNGELRQDSNTSDMVFSVPELVSYCSQYMTLEPGDLISTGTPEGVILGMEPKVWLKSGDRYEVEVEGLGRLANTLR